MPAVEPGCLTARGVVRGIADDGFVEIELEETPRCAGCAGMCMWRRIDADRKTRVPATSPVRAGTPVLVSLPHRCVLQASLLLHGLPWAALLLGAACGASTLHGDFGALVGALVAVGLAVLLTPELRRRVEQNAIHSLKLTPLK